MKYEINLLNVPNQSTSCNLVDDNSNFFAVDINLRTLMDGNLIIDISGKDFSIKDFVKSSYADTIKVKTNKRNQIYGG